MLKARVWVNTLCVLGGALLLSGNANAYAFDAKILIGRALNSPTITVRYTGANASKVELRVNGQSYSTREVNASKDADETNFRLILSELNQGDNEIEVVLYDKNGKKIASEKSQVKSEVGVESPVFIASPKVGAELHGNVDIKVGFSQTMRNPYVSFFINGDFKDMHNFPPYTYRWDTTMYPNGWHELEAWVVDETSTTFKTSKTKVFINNGGGNTPRIEKPIETPKIEKPKPEVVKATPKEKPTLSTVSNPIKPPLGASANSKGTRLPGSISSAYKVMTPTGTRNAVPKPPVNSIETVKNTIKPVVGGSTTIKANPTTPNPTAITNPAITEPKTTGKSFIPVSVGTRLPKGGKFDIMLNNHFVNFDVQPRIQNGVPLTPFRHLLESAGGSVNWTNATKSVDATTDGKTIWFKIGDKDAKINSIDVTLEMAPFIEGGRAIIPLSFIREALDVDVDYDPATGHVLITKKK